MIELLNSFYKDFAASSAKNIIESDEIDSLYLLATGTTPKEIPKAKRDMLIFRAAYILEYIYFNYSDYFTPYKERFYADFPKTTNGSAKRHFTKIMKDLLSKEMPKKHICNSIAEACAMWIIEKNVRVVVQIGSIEVLRLLRRDVEWIDEALPVILEPITRDPSPAIIVRLREWRK